MHMQDVANTKDVGVEYYVVIDLLCPILCSQFDGSLRNHFDRVRWSRKIQIYSSTTLCSALRDTSKIPEIKKKGRAMKEQVAIKVNLAL